jgi:hypothetical protein
MNLGPQVMIDVDSPPMGQADIVGAIHVQELQVCQQALLAKTLSQRLAQRGQWRKVRSESNQQQEQMHEQQEADQRAQALGQMLPFGERGVSAHGLPSFFRGPVSIAGSQQV